MRFAVINPNGTIQQTGTIPERMDILAMQGGDLLSVPLPDDVAQETHWWDYLAMSFRPLPPRPGPWAAWDGEAWIDPRTPEDLAAELAAAIATGKDRIVETAVRFENHFITPLPAQVEKYRRKEAHGRAYLAALLEAEHSSGAIPPPDDADPRWSAVFAEVGPGLTGETCFQVATIYVSKADIWYRILDAYDPLRIRHVNRVEAAATPEAAAQAVAAFQGALQEMADAVGIGVL